MSSPAKAEQGWGWGGWCCGSLKAAWLGSCSRSRPRRGVGRASAQHQLAIRHRAQREVPRRSCQSRKLEGQSHRPSPPAKGERRRTRWIILKRGQKASLRNQGLFEEGLSPLLHKTTVSMLHEDCADGSQGRLSDRPTDRHHAISQRYAPVSNESRMRIWMYAH